MDAFEGGFLSALAAHDHYSVAVGCLWGCSRAENRGRDEVRRSEARRGEGEGVARRSLSTFRKGRLLTEKVANLKGPPAFLSLSTKGLGIQKLRERDNSRRTSDFEQAIMLLRNVYNEIIVSGILRLG